MPSSPTVPIHHRVLLTLEEASAYSGIGINRLRELSHDPEFARECVYVSGRRRMFKRRPLREYLEMSAGVCYD